MDIRISQTLADWKVWQMEEHLPCPRCGLDAMDAHPARNALSRSADIYVCDACGTDEAMRVFHGNVLPLEEWACMKE